MVRTPEIENNRSVEFDTPLIFYVCSLQLQ